MTATVVTAQRKTKCLIQRNYRGFSLHQTRVRNSLRIARCTVNELKSSTPFQSVPKKNKIVQAEIGGGPPEAGGSPAGTKSKKTPRRPSATRKSAVPAGTKSVPARKPKVSMPSEAGRGTEPSDEEIRMRAYFISERRRRFALPGDADSDWLEAKRQLLSESGPR
jgi:hypothetical protein